MDQGPVDAVGMADRPPHVGCCKHRLSRFPGKQVLHGHRQSDCIPGRVPHNALRPGRCPGCIQQVTRFGAIEPDWRHLGFWMLSPEFRVIHVPPRSQAKITGQSAIANQYMLWRKLRHRDRFIDKLFQRDHLAATQAGVRSDHQLGFRVVNPGRETGRGESGEND